jgi:hypothetical protein
VAGGAHDARIRAKTIARARTSLRHATVVPKRYSSTSLTGS